MTAQMPLLDRAVASSARTPTVQAIGPEQFNVRKFVDSFGAMAAAEGGPARLRELAIELAVQGLLLDRVDRSSWKRVLLSDVVAEFQNGIAKRRSDAGKRIPVLRLADIERGNRIRNEGLREIALTVTEQEKYRVRRGDILVIRVNGSADLVGRFVPCEVERDWAYSDHLIRVRPRADLVDTGFVCALARSAASRAHVVANTVTTAGQRTINQVGLGSLPLLLPPLAEQKRIVARVDQLMALIDDLEAKQTKKRDLSTRFTKASLEALTTADSPEAFDTAWQRVLGELPTVLDRSAKVADLRRAIRDLAVSGRLVGDVNGASTVDTRADGAFLIPKRWSWCSLGELAVATAYGTSQKAHEEPDGVPVLRMNNIQETRLNLTSLKYVPPETEKLDELMLAQGDLLFNRTNSYELVGKMAVFRETGPFTFASYLIRVRLNPELAVPEYVNLYFASSVCRRTQIEPNITVQTNQANFNGTKLKELAVPTPGVDEQKRIVAKVEHLMKLCEDLEAKLRRAEDRASKLVEAVVQEMVAQ